jgi:hypothetical protein
MDERRFDRRRALKGAALGVGAVWATPVVRSLRIAQIAGSPAPPTSGTTTVPSPRTIEFSGTLTLVDQISVEGACFGLPGTGLFLQGALTNLGASSVLLGLCIAPPPHPLPPPPITLGVSDTGQGFELDAPDGSLVGNVGGSTTGSGFSLGGLIFGGGGDFTGATGNYTIELNGATGTITGNINLPA